MIATSVWDLDWGRLSIKEYKILGEYSWKDLLHSIVIVVNIDLLYFGSEFQMSSVSGEVVTIPETRCTERKAGVSEKW